MLDKASELPYSELEKHFKKQIMEPLADTILTKTVRILCVLIACYID
jgi:hypothetical protein